MYYLESALSREDYISALKQTFRSPFQLWDERVCGTVLGPFFSVAYHSPHEWNRKITDEVNRAWAMCGKRMELRRSILFAARAICRLFGLQFMH